MVRIAFVSIAVSLLTILSGRAEDKPTGIPSRLQFNRDIRPILSENCFACHGHDKNQRKAKLRLDDRQVALDRGAIVPGKTAESKLVEHIFASDPDEIMPPPKSRKVLTDKQKELLKQWIAEGAEYEAHWAYIKPKRLDPPNVKESIWVRNPIDAFILQGLEARSISHSPEADKRTLLRRLSLDLIGLPPTTEEMDAFLADKSPSAYERQVDRLLASVHFGERMTVPWLDVVRFTDTVGYHGDQNQDIFPYRDYVIDSFNRNKPFNQFTVEQLAGDLIPNPTEETRVATGFNRLNMMTREGGAQPKEYMAKYAADRARTISMAWLGSTIGCAECHDHKYDPFTSKDFYQIEAFFADLKQWGVYMDYGYTPNPDLRGYSNDHPFPPEIEVDNPYLQHRIEKLNKEVAALHVSIAQKISSDEKINSALEQWTRESREFLQTWTNGWAAPCPEVTLKLKDTNSVAETNFTIGSDQTITFSETPKESTKVALSLTNVSISAIRLEISPQDSTPPATSKSSRNKKRSGTAISPVLSLKSSDGKEKKLPLYFGDADHKQERYSNGQSILGVTDLWQISTQDENEAAVWVLQKPVKLQEGDTLIVNLGNAAVHSARVSVSPFPAGEPLESGIGEQLAKALRTPAKRRTPAQTVLVTRTFVLATTEQPEVLAQDRKLQSEIRDCRKGRGLSMVAVAREPVVTRVLARGNWQDESGEVVQPSTPHFLPQLPNPDNRRLTRLDLANWLVWNENPLTSRAVMNRLWKQFFGTGISAVVDDLGGQGDWPVQPELLDWLACEFMQPLVPDQTNPDRETRTRKFNSEAQAKTAPHAWDIKHMVKLMVMSSTYRQSSNQRPELKEIDPSNRLLSCQAPRRLEAEFVRDNALAIAGLLNYDIGGPGVHPYQPPGYYANLQFPDRDYYSDRDDRQYRRGVYIHWQRTFLQPMLANFDAPAREECVANRNISNTPQQALTLLNDPTFVEASRVFAAQTLSAPCSSDTQRLDWIFARALARAPRPNERDSLLSFLAAQREHYEADSEEAVKLLHVGNAPAPNSVDARELAAWTQVCRVTLNLHETITKY